MLTDSEREHLFNIGLPRVAEIKRKASRGISPRLQRLLDAFPASPAIIKTALWDVVAWNAAATVVLADYGAMPADQRNILRFLFCNPDVRSKAYDWDAVARFIVGAFRADVSRAGVASDAAMLVEELCRESAEFQALWTDNEVHSHAESDGMKRLRHPTLGAIHLEVHALSLDGHPDLQMIVYNPVDASQAERIRQLAAEAGGGPL